MKLLASTHLFCNITTKLYEPTLLRVLSRILNDYFNALFFSVVICHILPFYFYAYNLLFPIAKTLIRSIYLYLPVDVKMQYLLLWFPCNQTASPQRKLFSAIVSPHEIPSTCDHQEYTMKLVNGKVRHFVPAKHAIGAHCFPIPSSTSLIAVPCDCIPA